MAKISVIVPIYNVENYLSDCLESILSQSLADIELIGIDDCSTDQSINVLEKYASKDKRIKIVKNEFNRGPGYSRNKGVTMATGKYIMFVDSDDMMTEGSLLALYNKAEEDQVDGVLFDIDSIYEIEADQYNIAKCHPHKHEYSGVYTGQELFAIQFDNGDLQLTPYICLWRRAFILNNNLFFPESIWHEDVPFAVCAFMRADRMVFLRKRCYVYRRRDNSITTGTWGEKNLIGLVRGLSEIIRALTKYSTNVRPNFSASVMEYIFNAREMIRANLIDSVRKGVYISYPTDVDFLEFVEWQNIARARYKYIRGIISPESYRKLAGCETIIIYGAGTVGLEVINLLKEYALNNYLMAITKKKTDGVNLGISSGATLIEELADKQEKKIIIIAVGQKLQEQMEDNAVRLGFKNIIRASDL